MVRAASLVWATWLAATLLGGGAAGATVGLAAWLLGRGLGRWWRPGPVRASALGLGLVITAALPGLALGGVLRGVLAGLVPLVLGASSGRGPGAGRGTAVWWFAGALVPTLGPWLAVPTPWLAGLVAVVGLVPWVGARGWPRVGAGLVALALVAWLLGPAGARVWWAGDGVWTFSREEGQARRDGVDMLLEPTMEAPRLAATILVQHPSPRRVCVLGAWYPGLVPSLLDAGVERIVVVTPGRETMARLSGLLPPGDASALADPRVALVEGSARSHLARSGPFDMVLVIGGPEEVGPREVTVEGLRGAFGRGLSRSSVVAWVVPARGAATAWRTLKSAFPRVLPAPGPPWVLFAARSGGLLTPDVDTLDLRLESLPGRARGRFGRGDLVWSFSKGDLREVAVALEHRGGAPLRLHGGLVRLPGWGPAAAWLSILILLGLVVARGSGWAMAAAVAVGAMVVGLYAWTWRPNPWVAWLVAAWGVGEAWAAGYDRVREVWAPALGLGLALASLTPLLAASPVYPAVAGLAAAGVAWVGGGGRARRLLPWPAGAMLAPLLGLGVAVAAVACAATLCLVASPRSRQTMI